MQLLTSRLCRVNIKAIEIANDLNRDFELGDPVITEVSVSIHYSLFCMFLDLDDPSRVVRRAEEPLLTPAIHPWHLPKFPLSVAGLCTLVP